MKRIAILLAALMGAATQANAQFAPPSGGEVGSFLKCFYECKPGPDVQGVATYQEITTLMLTNQSPDFRHADVFYFDGREQCIAHSDIELSSVDLDELSVCHTLDLGGAGAPPAGLVEIIVTDPLSGIPGDGVYAWGKNVLGKFRTDDPEPFNGRVTGIGKYECRVVPIEVGVDAAVAAKCVAPVDVTPILVEETEDPPMPCPGDISAFPACAGGGVGGGCPPPTVCGPDPTGAPECVCI